jgi:hypothetical protein
LAKFILLDTRKRTSPKLFEALILLKVSRSFRNVFMVGKAMGRISKLLAMVELMRMIASLMLTAIAMLSCSPLFVLEVLIK